MGHKMRFAVRLGYLAAELALYLAILTVGKGHFIAIALCFCFALLQGRNPWITAALACTVMADFFLVVCDPVQRLLGMVFFLLAQGFYAIVLHHGKGLLIARIGLILAAEAVTVLVLGSSTDPLALVSLCYYANLIMNIICAFTRFREKKLMSIALVLFLLCDTVIGLQVMSSLYLPIPEGSPVYRLLYPGFDIAWLFYLPSQVLLALCSEKPLAK